MYNIEDVLCYVEEEDVKFIRLAFCDVWGRQKNISIMPEELPRAFAEGISFDASAVEGFSDELRSDLFLHPDPSTLAVLPWRPQTGRVVRMYCSITYPDGIPYEKDCRQLLIDAVKKADAMGISCHFGAEFEFYLFKTDEEGNPTKIPFDRAGYMDIAPEDKGENVRREICLTLRDMGIFPESSHHEEGPGQNEIDFRYGDPLSAADNAATFKSVVRTIAGKNGLFADFSPLPLEDQPGNGLHINMSVEAADGKDVHDRFMAGILAHIREITLFLNPRPASYQRLGRRKAPRYITWSPENRSQLIRIPAPRGGKRRIELRSPDPLANPYLAYTVLLRAGLKGIEHKLPLPEPTNLNLYTADPAILDGLRTLPANLEEARRLAARSDFLREFLPDEVISLY